MNRPLIIAAIGLLVVVLAIGLNYFSKQPTAPDESTSAEPREDTGPTPGEPAEGQSLQPPTFDVVRVGRLADAAFQVAAQ